jgi:hypothetical protein
VVVSADVHAVFEQVAGFRKKLEKVVGDKHEEVMGRMGAIMATGLLDAGGRNLTVALRSASGYFRHTSIVGLMLFLQYWYWYPLSYCLSLALQPSAFIALNGDLKLPKLQVSAASAAFALLPSVCTSRGPRWCGVWESDTAPQCIVGVQQHAQGAFRAD